MDRWKHDLGLNAGRSTTRDRYFRPARSQPFLVPEARDKLEMPAHTPFRSNASTAKKKDSDRGRQDGESSLEEGEIRLVPNSVKRAKRRAGPVHQTPATTRAIQSAGPSTGAALVSPEQSYSTRTQTSNLKRFFDCSDAVSASSEQSKKRRRSLPTSEAPTSHELVSTHDKLQRAIEPRSEPVYTQKEISHEATGPADLAQTDYDQPAAATPPVHDLWRLAFLTVRNFEELRQHSLPSSSDSSVPSRPAVQIAVPPTANPNHASAQTKAVETIVLEDDELEECVKPPSTPAAASADPVAASRGSFSIACAPLSTLGNAPCSALSAPDLAYPSGAPKTTQPGPLPSFLTGANSLAISRSWGSAVTPGSVLLDSTETITTGNSTEALSPLPEVLETATPTVPTKRQRQRKREQKAVQTKREQKAAKARAAEAAIAAAVLKERESLQGSLRAIRCLEKLAWTAEELQHMRNLMADQPFWVKSIKATRRKLGWFARTFKRQTDTP